MDSDRIKEQILANAAEIVRLHSRIHETLKYRTKSPEKRREWEQACAEFHARYEGLAFPGSYRNALERISRVTPKRWRRQFAFWNCAHISFAQVTCSKQYFHDAGARRLPLRRQGGCRYLNKG
jgi:hypothetical protein